MKHLKFLFFLSFITAILITTSCGDEDDNNNNSNETYFRCKIDGVDYEANSLGLAAVEIGTTLSIQTFESDQNGKGINISLNSTYNGTGTYVFEEATGLTFNLGSYLPIFSDPTLSYVSSLVGGSAGQIEITTVESNYIQGSFEFNAIATSGSLSVSITDGEFRVPK